MDRRQPTQAPSLGVLGRAGPSERWIGVRGAHPRARGLRWEELLEAGVDRFDCLSRCLITHHRVSLVGVEPPPVGDLYGLADRRLSSVSMDAQGIGMPEQRVAVLRAWVRDNVVDPKKADAIALLHRVRHLPSHPIPIEDRPKLVMSGVFSATLSRDTFVDPDNTPELTHDRIRRYASLHRPEYPELARRARARLVLGQISVAIGGQPTEEEFEKARDRVAARVGVEVDDLDAFFQANDVSAYAAQGIVGLEAAVYRIEHSWLSLSRMGSMANGVIAEMVLSGTYQEIKQEAALQYQAAATVTFDPPPEPQTIVSTFVGLTGFDPGMGWDEFVDRDEQGQFAEVLAIMEVSVKAHHALFGTGLVSGGDQHFILDDGPMQTRGR